MGAILGFAVLIFCVWLLSRSIRDARSNPWTGPRTPGMRSRASAPPKAAGRGRTVLRSAGAVIAHPSNLGLGAADVGEAGSASRVLRMYVPDKGRAQLIEGGAAAQAARLAAIIREFKGAAP